MQVLWTNIFSPTILTSLRSSRSVKGIQQIFNTALIVMYTSFKLSANILQYLWYRIVHDNKTMPLILYTLN